MIQQRPDVCIVGLGAAGTVAAYVLAEAGLKVVALEAGRSYALDEFKRDEIAHAYWQRAGMGPKFNQETQTWRPHAEAPTIPATYSLGRMMNAVGGSTIHYGTWMRRFSPDDFRVRSATVARYGEEALPEGHAMADWPISYDDLEPYYSRTEAMMGIAGVPGNIRGEAVLGGNPFEGYRSAGLPLPALRPCRSGALFSEATRRLGYHPYPVPSTINSQAFDGRPACTYCGWCNGFGCTIDAKSHSGNTFLPRALATGNLEVRSGCRVVRILTGSDRRARGVEYLDPTGTHQTLEAPVVILACYTFEIVRLLLLSASEQFPRGLANNHDQVGRYYLTKQFPHVNGLIAGTALNRHMGPAGQGVIMEDLLGDNFDHTGLGFIRGATLSAEQQLQPISIANEVLPPDIPRWGAAYKEYLLRHWNEIMVIRLQPECLPYHSNFMDLDPHRRDRSGLGLPVVRITFELKENERRLIAHMQERATAILREIGAARTWQGRILTGVGSSHDCGGARMGIDPANSVVDAGLMTHEVPNLYVFSGATFVSCPGVNPTLTLKAACWHAADRLVRDRQHGTPLAG